MRVIGSMLVHNEDVFVEQAIRNAAAFCDRIHAVDHMSTDGTWEILQELALELDHLDVRRARHSRVSHEVLEPYAGTDTWVMRIDGDELYDPFALTAFEPSLRAGAHQGVFRILGNVLHAVEVDPIAKTARGHLSPPSRPISALYNFGAVASWTGALERLHSGRLVFRDGYAWDSVEPLYQHHEWDDSPLRCLHVCFVRRSSEDVDDVPRPNLSELDTYRRDSLGVAERLVRRSLRRPAANTTLVAMRTRGSSWKQEKYRRGEPVSVDASPFFGEN